MISLSDKVKRYLNDGLISLGHAKLLINLPDSDKVADIIVKRNLNVRDAENYIKYREEKPSAPKKDSHQLTRSEFVPKSTDIDELERSLSMALGMEVEIVGYGSGGTISLHYHHLEQLDQIVQKLTSSVK